MANLVEGDIARDCKEERLGVVDVTSLAGAKQTLIGFLHKIVDIGKRGESVAQKCPKGRLVWLHLLGKPAGLRSAERLAMQCGGWGHGAGVATSG